MTTAATKDKGLTDDRVAKLPLPAKGQKLVWDSSLSGFGVRLTPGARTFICEARVSGRTVRVSLGRFGVLTTKQARAQAKQRLGDMAGGADPNAQKRVERIKSATLADLMEAYTGSKQRRDGKALKPRTIADIKRHVTVTYADWANKPASDITRDAVQARYVKLCKTSVAQANQAFRVLSALLRWSIAKEQDASRTNPCAVLSDLSLWREVKPRTDHVPAAEIGRWWSALTAMRNDPALYPASKSAADAIALMLLTGLRSDEARSIKWADVDLKASTVHLRDTKNRSDLLLPLSKQAAAVIDARPRENEYVFHGKGRTGYLKSPRHVLAELGQHTGIEVTPHDLRRTFIITGAKTLGIELWRVKRLANHAVPKTDVTATHYLAIGEDASELRADVQRIADHIEREAAKFEAGNVVTLRA
jgi:integrase